MDKLLSVGIEAEKLAWDKGHFRIERDGQARYQYCDNGNGATLAAGQDPTEWAVSMFQTKKVDETITVSSRVYSEEYDLTVSLKAVRDGAVLLMY